MASPATVGQAILNAGFRGDDAATMLAIGFAESGLNERAINDSAIERSLGWPQINTRVHNVPDDCAYDVQCAANYAFTLYQGRGNSFTDWSTYTNGSYLAYIDRSRATMASLGNATTGPAQTGQSLLAAGAVLLALYIAVDVVTG